MSAELVMAGPEQPVVHNALHDLESFFYVLVGICVLYSEPSKQKTREELAECYDPLFNTFGPSILKTLTIQSNLTWFPKVVNHISPYFQPVIPLLNVLRNEIILPLYTDTAGNFHRSTSFDHDTITRQIILLLSSLKPEAWGLDSDDTPPAPCDASPTPMHSDAQKRARNMLAPPMLSVERPFLDFGRLAYSDSGVYRPPHDTSVGEDHHPSQVPSSARLFAPLPKRAIKYDTPLPPPLIPLHDSLLASGRHISWSDSLVSSMRSHDPDEYVPNVQQKRARVESIPSQGPFQQGSSNDDNIVRRSSRRKAQ